MTEVTLHWHYINSLEELDSHRNALKGSGIYIWIMKNSVPPRIFYVGESNNIWSRTIDHIEETIAGRWLIQFYLSASEDYIYFLKNKVAIPNVMRSLSDVKFPPAKDRLSVKDDMFSLFEIEKRIQYLRQSVAFGYAIVERDMEIKKLSQHRQDIESCIIWNLLEAYANTAMVSKKDLELKGEKAVEGVQATRPLDYILGGIKKYPRDVIIVKHEGASAITGLFGSLGNLIEMKFDVPLFGADTQKDK